jgi:hypothetical protein
MAKSKHKRTPKTIVKLPDLEQSKSAGMNSLTSASSKRSYDRAIREFIDCYCSEPRLAFNPARRFSRNRLLQRSINASLQSSLSRIAGPCTACLQQQHQPCPARIIGTPAAARRSLIKFHTFRVRQYDRVLHEHNHTTSSAVYSHCSSQRPFE